MKIKIIQNPITHIILFGFLLAVVLLIIFGIPTNKDDNRRIVISNSDIEQLWSTWKRTWQRDPTPAELRGQLQQYVREEVLYREALSRNYDRDDIVIRRSLVRKMDFLAEGQVEGRNLTDEEIKAYYNLRSERYRIPPKISFVHIYFNIDKRGDDIEPAINEALRRLGIFNPNDIDLSIYGDRFMLPSQFAQLTPREIQSQFGEIFANELLNLEPGKWHGPVHSGYGFHIVYVYNLVASRIPDWTEVKSQIYNDMVMEEKVAAKEQFYTEILRQYQIVYEDMPQQILSGNDAE